MFNNLNDDDIKLEVRQDGIYLVIDNHNNKTITKNELIRFIEGNGVKDIELNVLNDILSDQKFLVSEALISKNTELTKQDESITINISQKNMLATIKFNKAINGGVDLTYEKLISDINNSEVKAGIDYDSLKQEFNNRSFDVDYILARGEMPVDGKNGELIYCFDTSKSDNKPKLLKDGTVDFKDLNLVTMKYAGDELIKVVPPEEGIDGFDILGNVLPAKYGKEVKIPSMGKNVKFDSEKKIIYAEISGQVIFDGRKLDMSSVLEIKGNVDNSTGNINFNGSVIIKGTVTTGFTVECTGDIEIYGVVEGAKIFSGNNAFLYAGVHGLGKAEIEAQGNIIVKYAANCMLCSGKDIISDCITHCNVICEGNLNLSGKNGLLLGGNTSVKNSIYAQTIGSRMATRTDISAGNNPNLLNTYNQLVGEFTKYKGEYDKTALLITKMNDDLGGLSNDKKLLLLKAIQKVKILNKKLVSIKTQINDIFPKVNLKSGEIAVSKIIYTAVNIKIGNAVLHVQDEMRHCKLRNKDGEINISSYS